MHDRCVIVFPMLANEYDVQYPVLVFVQTVVLGFVCLFYFVFSLSVCSLENLSTPYLLKECIASLTPAERLGSYSTDQPVGLKKFP